MLRQVALGSLFLLVSSNAWGAHGSGAHGSGAEWRASQAPRTLPGSARSVAEAHLALERAELRLDGVTLIAERVLPAGRHHTVRFAQRHHGLPVIGGQVAVRVAPGGRATLTVLEVARNLIVDPTPRLTAKQARRDIAMLAGVEPVKSELAVLPNRAGGRLVWQIDVPTANGGERYLVDAHDGRVIARRPLGVDVLGRVYPVSSVSTPETQDVELLDLVPSTPQLLTGWNGNLVVTNYVSGGSQNGYQLEQTVQPNAGADFLYDPPGAKTDPADAFAQVGIYHHLTRMRDFYTAALGLDFGGASWKLVAVANVKEDGSALNNAFFSPLGAGAPWNAPNMIAIGQGSSFDFAQDSDVFNHEFTHYVTGNAINFNAGSFHFTDYGRSPFSAAIDEGIADYFACTVNGDPMLGEASLALLSAGRDLSDTSKSCPSDMSAESHADGEIIGSFAWTLRTMLGSEIADELVWSATTLLPFGATFGDFGRGILQAADELVAEGTLAADDKSSIESALAERGLDQCDAELPLLSEEPRTERTRPFNNCADAKAEGRYRQGLFHYFVTPGPDAIGVALGVAFDAVDPTQLSWNVYVRKGEHVTFEEGFPPTLAAHDYAFESITAGQQEIIIDADSDPPFEAGQSYHFILRHQNCTQSTVTFSTRDLTPEPTEEPEQPVATPPTVNPTEESATGCACRTAPSSPVGWRWSLLGLPLLVAVRRRARRSHPRS